MHVLLIWYCASTRLQLYIKYSQSQRNERDITALMKVMENNCRVSSLSFPLRSQKIDTCETYSDSVVSTFASQQQVYELKRSLWSLLCAVYFLFASLFWFNLSLCKDMQVIARGVKHKHRSALHGVCGNFNLHLTLKNGAKIYYQYISIYAGSIHSIRHKSEIVMHKEICTLTMALLYYSFLGTNRAHRKI